MKYLAPAIFTFACAVLCAPPAPAQNNDWFKMERDKKSRPSPAKVVRAPVVRETSASAPESEASALEVAEAPATPLLTNDDVINMMAAQLSPALIVSKIKASSCAFETSTATLSTLKTKGVPEQILQAMIESPGGVSASVGKEIIIPEGTPVEIETLNGVSSKDVGEGSAIDFLVVNPVRVAGVTVVEKGARARAVVTKAKGGASFGRAGELVWNMQDVIAADGTRVPLAFAKQTDGESKKGGVAKSMAKTGLYLGPGALLWGFKKGSAAIIPAGKQFDVSVAAATPVKGVISATRAASSRPAARTVAARGDGMPEYGDISEIRRMRRVYVTADDIDSMNRLVREISKYEGISAVGSPDQADFFISFGSNTEATNMVLRGLFGGTIDKNRKAQFIVYYTAASGRARIVFQETEDIQTSSGMTFSRANEVNVIRHFVKALRKERGEN